MQSQLPPCKSISYQSHQMSFLVHFCTMDVKVMTNLQNRTNINIPLGYSNLGTHSKSIHISNKRLKQIFQTILPDVFCPSNANQLNIPSRAKPLWLSLAADNSALTHNVVPMNTAVPSCAGTCIVHNTLPLR